MIKVSLIKNEDRVVGLEARGHGNTAEIGKDLLCAAVSAILTGGFNAFLDEDIEEVALDEGYAKIIIRSSLKAETILNTIIVQLKTIEVSYPENIKIK